jgi:hypothetical protein
MKIEKLTKEQEEKLIIYRDKWLNKIFKYELYNSMTEETVKIKMKELYKFCNLEEPIVLLVDSPLGCQFAANLLVSNQVRSQVWNQVRDQVENQVGDQVWNQVWDQVGSQVSNQVWDQVRSQVSNQVWDQVSNQVWNQVRDQVENQVRDQVWNQVRDQVWNQVGDQVWNQVWNQVGGQVWDQVRNNKLTSFVFSNYINFSDFGWLSFYNFFQNETNILNTHSLLLDSIVSFVENSFMSIQLKKLCIVSKYPSFISRNKNNQLHNISEAAIKFIDGYEQHYFNGIFIRSELFQQLISKSYTFKDWSKETNEEIKSLVLAFYEEKFGGEFIFRFLSQYLKEVDTYIDKKSEERLKNTTKGMNLGVYTLYKGNINDINIAYVRCYCPSTDRMFFLGVHPDINNAKDAIASLCQIPEQLKDNLLSINRQGEIFSFNFDEIGTNKLKNKEVDFSKVVSLKGDEYFSKIKFEY